MPPELVELELELEEELVDDDELLEVLLDDELVEELEELVEELLLDEVLDEELLDEGWPPPQATSKTLEISPTPVCRKKRLSLFIGLPPFIRRTDGLGRAVSGLLRL